MAIAKKPGKITGPGTGKPRKDSSEEDDAPVIKVPKRVRPKMGELPPKPEKSEFDTGPFVEQQQVENEEEELARQAAKADNDQKTKQQTADRKFIAKRLGSTRYPPTKEREHVDEGVDAPPIHVRPHYVNYIRLEMAINCVEHLLVDHNTNFKVLNAERERILEPLRQLRNKCFELAEV